MEEYVETLSNGCLARLDLLMILVTLGTQDKPFGRLLEAVEKQIENGNIQEEVIAQVGSTPYTSYRMKIIPYIPVENFSAMLEKANFVITHAGVGSIIEGLKKKKKMIVAARKKEYGEHVNNHQEQILENFSQSGYIIPLTDFDKLGEVIQQLKDFTPREFQSNQTKFVEGLEIQIENLLNSLSGEKFKIKFSQTKNSKLNSYKIELIE